MSHCRSGPQFQRNAAGAAPARRHPCGGYATPDRYPPGLSHRQQVVRAYDHDGRIADGVLASGGGQATVVIRELLARPDVALVHLRNVGWGCYSFAVRPGTA